MSEVWQPFFGFSWNDDSKHGLFMTKVQGVYNHRQIAWEQLVPTQWNHEVSTVFFTAYLGYKFRGRTDVVDAINGGRIYTLKGKKDRMKWQGSFTGRRLSDGLEKVQPELPAGTVAAMCMCGHMWCWSVVVAMNGSEGLMCWTTQLPRCRDGKDIQATTDPDQEGQEEMVNGR